MVWGSDNTFCLWMYSAALIYSAGLTQLLVVHFASVDYFKVYVLDRAVVKVWLTAIELLTDSGTE